MNEPNLHLERIRRTIEAAEVLLETLPHSDVSVARLIYQAWIDLGSLEKAAYDGIQPAKLFEIVSQTYLAKANVQEKETLAGFLQQCDRMFHNLPETDVNDSTPPLSSTIIVASFRLLKQTFHALPRTRTSPEPWKRTLAVGFVFFLALLTVGMFAWPRKEPAVWKGVIYDGMTSDAPILRDISLPALYFLNLDSFPKDLRRDYFSATFHSCLRVDRPIHFFFELGSDDGSQLRVNSKQVIDNGGLHVTEAKTGSLFLEKGVHLIEVNFTQASGNAALFLKGRTSIPKTFVLDHRHLRMPHMTPKGPRCDAAI